MALLHGMHAQGFPQLIVPCFSEVLWRPTVRRCPPKKMFVLILHSTKMWCEHDYDKPMQQAPTPQPRGAKKEHLGSSLHVNPCGVRCRAFFGLT